MRAKIIRTIVAGLCGVLTACAIITVNVYFPEKDVKQAYKSLDEMLLKQGGGAKTPADEKQPAGEEKKPEEAKPQSRLFNFSLISEAWAQDKVADDLAIEMSSMPEVLRAYDEMKARLPELNALRASGAVGETNQGLVSVREAAKAAGKEGVVKGENDNRKTVITGMAKAILKINKQPVTDAGINQVLGKAAATYASIKQEEAKPGWWVQLPNGRWVQK